ncbi:MAG: DUF3106 domain-containing protein, partial [Rhodanobacter sp.]
MRSRPIRCCTRTSTFTAGWQPATAPRAGVEQMTPEERAQARGNMRKFHAMSPAQREQLHATFDRFQHLPPAQREKLMQQWHALTPEQRLR